MTTIHPSEAVSIWTADDRPARLVWREGRYLVTDTPTLRIESFDEIALTNPVQRVQRAIGRRFQARSLNDGDARVFDVHFIAGTRWELMGVYS